MNQILNNRVALKFNSMMIEEAGKIYISRNMEQGILFNLTDVRLMILNKEFENFINVSISGENGISGPNIKPSRKGLKRLMKIINGTNYKIVQQNGQQFTLEGVN